MAPMVEAVQVLNVVLWVIMFFVATLVLVQVSNYFTGESPQTLLKAFRATAVVAAVVYFTYDVSGYLFALLMQDPTNGIRMPAHYTYWDWMREPFALKWYVLGFVPIIRFIPVGFALLAGSVVHVFLLDVPYHVAVVVFLAQLFLDIVALVVLSFVFNFGIQLYVRDVVIPDVLRERAEEAEELREAPRSLHHLHGRIQNLPPEQGPFWRRLEAGWSSANGNLQPFYDVLRPVTKHLPHPAQSFLDGGGWLVVLPGLAALGFYWPRIHRERTRLHHRRRKRRAGPARQSRVLLAEIGESLTGLGARQVTVQGVLGRLRLVVLAPAAPGAPPLPEGSHGPVLDAAVPGLAEAAAADFPKVECWADRPARESFRATFVDGVKIPDAPGEPSRWVLVAGEVVGPQGPYHLGLAVLAEKPSAARVLDVFAGQWAAVVGVREVPVEERGI